VQALLAAKANAKLKSKEGKTAWDYAKDNRRIRGTPLFDELDKARQ
jgi:hypothetical protein